MTDHRLDWEMMNDTQETMMTPGVVSEIGRYLDGNISVGSINSRRRNTTIGRVLDGLENIGFLEPTDFADKYRATEEDPEGVSKSFEEIKRKAQENYMEKIKSALSQFDEEAVTSDIVEKGIKADHNGDSLFNYNNDGYSPETLGFLEEVEVIDDKDSRNFKVDSSEIKHVEAYVKAKALEYDIWNDEGGPIR